MVWAILNADQNAALKELIEEQKSDRAVAVLGGALLDESLRRALELRLRPQEGKTDMNEKLFRVAGPLGNLGPKVDLAYQLYMLDKPHRDTMHGLSEIRNLFAHSLSMNFANTGAKLKDALAKLPLHQGRTYYPSPLWEGDTEYEIEPTVASRDKFIVNLKLALIHLMADQNKHEPWRNTPTKLRMFPPKDSITPNNPVAE